MAKSEKRSFRYQKRSVDDFKERQAMKGGGFDSYIKPKFKVYKVKDGKNLIRILPATWEKARHYGYDIFVNYNIGVDNQSYLSLSKMQPGTPDPIADARRKAEKEGDKELAKQLAPRQRILMWVIDRMEEDEGPLLWAAPFTVDKAFIDLSFDEDTKEIINIDDPNEGCDIRFYKEGKGLNTDYPAAKMRILKASPISEDEELQKQWEDYIAENPIPECLNFYDAEHIEAVFDGNVGSYEERSAKKGKKSSRDDDDDDEDEKPKRKVKPADEDEEDEKPRSRRAVPEDDAEDEAPKRRPRSRVDEDDEEEKKPSHRGKADDEDEEDEPPKKRRKPAEDDDEEVEDEKPKRGRVTSDDGEDDDTSGSIRDRLKRRRQASSKSDDEDDE